MVKKAGQRAVFRIGPHVIRVEDGGDLVVLDPSLPNHIVLRFKKRDFEKWAKVIEAGIALRKGDA